MSGPDPDQLLIKATELYEDGDLKEALALLDQDFAAIGRTRIVEGRLWALHVLCKREIFEEALGDEDLEEEDTTDWTAELRADGATNEFLLAAGIFFSEEYAYDLAEVVMEHFDRGRRQ